jgi:hypothetical protein
MSVNRFAQRFACHGSVLCNAEVWWWSTDVHSGPVQHWLYGGKAATASLCCMHTVCGAAPVEPHSCLWSVQSLGTHCHALTLLLVVWKTCCGVLGQRRRPHSGTAVAHEMGGGCLTVVWGPVAGVGCVPVWGWAYVGRWVLCFSPCFVVRRFVT